MEQREKQVRVCPKCGQEFRGRPAISRKDNETPICPDCGTREALETLNIGKAEQDEIIALIHRRLEE